MAQEHRIGIPGQEQVEIPEQDDCPFRQFLDGHERFHRVIGLPGRTSFAVHQPGSGRPGEQLEVDLPGNSSEFRLQSSGETMWRPA